MEVLYLCTLNQIFSVQFGVMRTVKVSKESNRFKQKILLIGKLNGVFLDGSAIGKLECQVCENQIDAIRTATKHSFDIVVVVISSLSAQLNSVLQTIRRNKLNARIILLAQMFEEPIAIQLVNSKTNGAKLADDYLICPIQSGRFYEFVTADLHRDTAWQKTSAVIDAATEDRIRQLERLATEDDLTGLKNRRYIWEFAEQIIKHAENENGRVTLLVFDIDNFKHYNDVYGHSAGDEILKQASVLMGNCCRQHDVVGRIGGDEFAVIFWDFLQSGSAEPVAERRSAAAEHPREAIFVAKRFRKDLKRAELHLLGPEGRGVLTISGGLATFPYDGVTIQELFEKADEALLEAKRSGKNRIYLVGKAQNDIADIE